MHDLSKNTLPATQKSANSHISILFQTARALELVSADLKIAISSTGVINVTFVESGDDDGSMIAFAHPATFIRKNSQAIRPLIEIPRPHSKRCVRDYGETHVMWVVAFAALVAHKGVCWIFFRLGVKGTSYFKSVSQKVFSRFFLVEILCQQQK